MKEVILEIVLYLARLVMQVIYFFIKLFTKQKNKVTMLSRQSDKINLDFEMLKEEIENNKLPFAKNSKEVEIKILCKKIPKGLYGKIIYCFYLIKCMYHLATSKACIIDGYNIAVSALKHKENLKIVQIWHAMGAIKKFGYQVLDKKEGSNSKIAKIMKMHNNYDCITCTSNATRKVYAEAFNTDINKIQVLGMPRIDYILGKNGKIDENIEKLKEKYPCLKEKKNILYIPTLRKEKEIDIEKIIIDNFHKMIQDENYPKETVQRHIEEIQEGLNVIKQNGDLEILKTLYIIEQNLYEELNKTNQTILIKENKGIFTNVTTAIIFALGYGKHGFRIGLQSKNLKDKHIILEVPGAIKDRVADILNANYKNWEAVFKVKIS